jgi:hypothetical protein
MHWQWFTGPSIAMLAAALTMAGLGQQASSGVADELSRVVGLLVPIVAALLSPLVMAIVFLFRSLVAEMRANREQTEKMARVILSNTAAFEANTTAAQRLTEGVAGLSIRVDSLEQRADRGDHNEHARRQQR